MENFAGRALSAAIVICGVALAGTAGAQQDHKAGDRPGDAGKDCTVVHRNGATSTGERDTDAETPGNEDGASNAMSSTITAGGGKVSGSTTMPGANTTSSSSSVSAGNGRVTTTTTHDGKGITVTGNGAAASAGSSGGGDSVTAGTTSDGDCTIVTD